MNTKRVNKLKSDLERQLQKQIDEAKSGAYLPKVSTSIRLNPWLHLDLIEYCKLKKLEVSALAEQAIIEALRAKQALKHSKKLLGD